MVFSFKRIIALLLIVGLSSGVLHGQESGSRPASTETVERRIERILDGPLRTPLDYEEMPLNQIFEVLEEEYGIPIRFDLDPLEENAQSPEAPTTIRLAGTSLRSAIELMLHGRHRFDYVIEGDVLMITTEDDANIRLVTRVYRVDDLPMMTSNEQDCPKGASAWADYDPLMGVITECIAPESWQENGTGEGVVKHLRPGMYVIRQTYRIHREIGLLLAEIRRCKAAIEQGAPARSHAPAAENPFAEF